MCSLFSGNSRFFFFLINNSEQEKGRHAASHSIKVKTAAYQNSWRCLEFIIVTFVVNQFSVNQLELLHFLIFFI